MLFNTFSYALFLPLVFFVYWASNRNLRRQNLWLQAASYFFYACWDWRFLFLLLFSTLLDFGTGIMMEGSKSKLEKRIWFWLSVVINLGFLGVFKYFNFFAESFADLLNAFGMRADIPTLKVILPVGISFYTFHGLSYVIDVYNERIKAERSFIDYALFVTFFPLLVAGPIERATHLLPQIKKPRTFNYVSAADGLRQILWGLFKKIVIADQIVPFVNPIFENPLNFSASTLLIGAVMFAFQIYGDFSGYSDIAIGTARLFGINLLRNFAYPYFSRDVAEFWRRWHISLSSWFRDYVYIPLGGSKGNTLFKVRNVLIIFLLSGFWHGANWTFIFWGFLNALFVILAILSKTNRNNLEIVAADRALPTAREFIAITTTFGLTVLMWIFFRAESMSLAWTYASSIFDISLFTIPNPFPKSLILVTTFLLVIEWMGRRKDFALAEVGMSWPRYLRWGFYQAIMLSILWVPSVGQQFVYFQF